MNDHTHVWQDGIFNKYLRDATRDESPDRHWLLFDGPIDANWVESLNSTLDNNKIFTAANGERLVLTPRSTVIFETHDLSFVTPATVSRLGIIYFN